MIEVILFNEEKNHFILNKSFKVNGILSVFTFEHDMNDSVILPLALVEKGNEKTKDVYKGNSFLTGYKVCYELNFEIHHF